MQQFAGDVAALEEEDPDGDGCHRTRPGRPTVGSRVSDPTIWCEAPDPGRGTGAAGIAPAYRPALTRIRRLPPFDGSLPGSTVTPADRVAKQAGPRAGPG